MATSQTSEVFERLRKSVLLPHGGALSDGQLLEDYISRRDDAALAALIGRHGPMVWGVCRRVLHNHHDAEDAFQATFLVLVRKATTIIKRVSVGNWLYGVAYKTALKARSAAAKRKTRETQVTAMPESAIEDQQRWRELEPVLDDELSRLPDQYRSVIVLCDLQSKTRSEAARQLRCPEGTVAGRLARARTMLAKRLTRRGVVLSGGMLAAVVSAKAASAGVPTTVAYGAIKSAGLMMAGAAGVGEIPTKVAVLVEGVIRSMRLNKATGSMLVVLMAAALSGSAGLIYETQAAQTPKPQPAAEKKDKPEPESSPTIQRDDEAIQGTWMLVKLDQVNAKSQGPDDNFKVVITGNKIVYPDKSEGKFRLDPSKDPKRFDYVVEKDGKTTTAPGIYSLKGDELKYCVGREGDSAPPADFDIAKAPPRTFPTCWTFRREKDPIEQREIQKLQGSWRMVRSESDGLTFDEGRPEIKDCALAIDKSSATMTTNVFYDPKIKKDPEVVKAIGTFSLDAKTKPRQIVFTWEKNTWLPNESLVQRFIYSVEGDTLKLCSYFPGADTKSLVPSEFSAGAGSKRTVNTWKRVSPAHPINERKLAVTDLSKIQPPAGVPLFPSKAPITVDSLEKVKKRLESAPAQDLDAWVGELERIMGQKLEGLSKQAARTEIVEQLSVAFADVKWDAQSAAKLFKRLQTLSPAEFKAWKEALEAVLKKEIGQTDKEVFDGGPAYAIPLYLIPVDAFYQGEHFSAERGIKYRARLKQLTSEDLSLWKSKVDRFGGTATDAAVNIILLDEFFQGEDFNRDRFRDAVEQHKKERVPADEADELEKLRGDWQLVSLRYDGIVMGEGRRELEATRISIQHKSLTLFCTAESIIAEPTSKQANAILALDVARGIVVLTWKECPWNGKKDFVRKAIYNVADDTLKICLSRNDDEIDAPADFSAKTGSQRLSWTFKRVLSPRKETAKTRARQDEADPKQNDSQARSPSAKSGTPPYLSEFQRLKEEMNKIEESLNKTFTDAKSEKEREEAIGRAMQIVKEKGEPLVDKVLELAKPHASEKEAAEILIWILNQQPASKAASAAAELLGSHHLQDPQTLDAVSRFQHAPMSWTEPLLKKLAAAELPRERKVLALVALAECAKNKAELPSMLKEFEPAMRSIIEDRLGKQYLHDLYAADPIQLEAEAVGQFEALAEKYGSEKYGEKTVKEYAEAALFEMRNLAVGKQAPEIEGADLDGKRFKLSDYRGKVVLLDFWGNW